MESTQADSELNEESLLDFVVNSLNDELLIELGDNIGVTAHESWEVLVGASGLERPTLDFLRI